MKTLIKYMNAKAAVLATLPVGLLLAGCPQGGGVVDPKLEYNAGFAVGFAEDGEYWQGFDDSYDTVDGGEIYYTGDLIPQLDDLSYCAAVAERQRPFVYQQTKRQRLRRVQRL